MPLFLNFSDVEKSEGNTFTAGELDLQVDSTCHYNGMVCECASGACTWQDDQNPSAPDPVPTPSAYIGADCACTWGETDLTSAHRFFDFQDIKPGDWGENTLSFHVWDNDAYGRVVLTAIENRENLCNEPERSGPTADTTCVGRWCGELAQNMYSFVWVDNGINSADPDDPTKGDNIYQNGEEIVIGLNAAGQGVCETGFKREVHPNGLTYCQVLPDIAADIACAWSMPDHLQDDLPYGQEVTIPLTPGGIFLKGCETNYLGVAWYVPYSVDNIIQGDSVKMDVTFEVIQARHNDPTNPWATPTP